MDPEDSAQQEKVARQYQDADHAAGYSGKHDRTFGTRFKDRREQALAKRALGRVGKVGRILDCPAGTGRFWGVLSGFCDELLVADASGQMIEAGRARHPDITLQESSVARVQELPHGEASVDLVFCSRLLHHFPDRAQRVEILSSLGTVSRKHVIFSAWVTGNWKHKKERARARRRPAGDQTRFFVPRQDLEEEVREAGLRVVFVLYKLRGISPLVMMVCEKC